jgi:hypothetical protein
MSDIATLSAAASKAQDALASARAEQAAASKAAADERTARSIEWAWTFVVSYNQRQGAAGERVSALLASITDAITVDLAAGARLYLDAVREMASANALGAELVKARAILKAAGELPGVYRTGRDPVGDNAPYPLTQGLIRFPTFLELVSETLDKQRAMASRVQSAEAPETFEGKASEGLKAEALRREWVLAAEFESLLALKVQLPAKFAQLPAEEQASVNAYARGRELVGYDGPLPKMVTEGRGQVVEPTYAPNDAVRIRLFSDAHAPSR